MSFFKKAPKNQTNDNTNKKATETKVINPESNKRIVQEIYKRLPLFNEVIIYNPNEEIKKPPIIKAESPKIEEKNEKVIDQLIISDIKQGINQSKEEKTPKEIKKENIKDESIKKNEIVQEKQEQVKQEPAKVDIKEEPMKEEEKTAEVVIEPKNEVELVKEDNNKKTLIKEEKNDEEVKKQVLLNKDYNKERIKKVISQRLPLFTELISSCIKGQTSSNENKEIIKPAKEEESLAKEKPKPEPPKNEQLKAEPLKTKQPNAKPLKEEQLKLKPLKVNFLKVQPFKVEQKTEKNSIQKQSKEENYLKVEQIKIESLHKIEKILPLFHELITSDRTNEFPIKKKIIELKEEVKEKKSIEQEIIQEKPIIKEEITPAIIKEPIVDKLESPTLSKPTNENKENIILNTINLTQKDPLVNTIREMNQSVLNLQLEENQRKCICVNCIIY